MPSREPVYERLESLLLGSEGERIRSFDREMRSVEPAQISVIFASESSQLNHIGNLLTKTDRELRRAVRILGVNPKDSDGSYYFGAVSDRPSPSSLREGGLLVEYATAGSLYLLVKAYGNVLSLLTSKPLAALTTLIALSQGMGSIRLWPRRHHDPLEGISASRLLGMIKELGGNPAELLGGYAASLEISAQPTTSKRVRAEDEDDLVKIGPPPIPDLADGPGAPRTARYRPQAEDEQEYVNLGRSDYFTEEEYESTAPEEIIARGRRITYIREYPDGTREIIYVDG